MSYEELKKMKEYEELKDFYWKSLASELYKEAEKELEQKGKYGFWKRITGIAEQEVKDLQIEKFEELWEKKVRNSDKGNRGRDHETTRTPRRT